jgi:hypothetical protein
MKLTVDEILDRAKRVDETRYLHAQRWERHEKMFQLDPGFRGTLQQDIAEGKERVIDPRPKNTVNIAKWNVGRVPQIQIPPASDEVDDIKSAEKCEKWLAAAWQQINFQQQTNVIQNAFHYEFLNGEHIFEVKWPNRSKSPKLLRERLFPISVRALHPSVAGLWRGPDYVEYAFTRYDTTILNVLQSYPDLLNARWGAAIEQKMRKFLRDDRMNEGNKVEVLEMFWIGQEDGEIWSALLVDDTFVPGYEPMATEYPLIPYVGGSGNHFEGILAAQDGIWQAKCRSMSYYMTGVMHNFLANYAVQNEFGESVTGLDWGLGKMTPVPWGTKIEPIAPDINVPAIQQVFQQFDVMLDQSGFSGVAMGQISGGVQAGFAINNLQQASISRIEPHREAVEISVSHVNQLILAYVDTITKRRGYKKGVPIWGRSERDNSSYRVSLTSDDIQGYYENHVSLRAPDDQTQTQRITNAVQLKNAALASDQTIRDKLLTNLPGDEQERIDQDQLMMAPQMEPVKRVMSAWKLTRATPEVFEVIVDQDPTWRAIAEKLGFLTPKPSMPTGAEQGMPLPPNSAPPMGDPMMAAPPISPPLPPPGPMPAAGELPPMQPPNPMAGMPGPGGGMPPAMVGQLEAENIGLPSDASALDVQPALGQPMTEQEIIDAILAEQGFVP